MELEMRRLILAALCIGTYILISKNEAHAFGWYRTHGDSVVASPGCYRFRSPRWNYDAAYYQTYHRYRAYGRKCRCR